MKAVLYHYLQLFLYHSSHIAVMPNTAACFLFLALPCRFAELSIISKDSQTPDRYHIQRFGITWS